MEINDSKVHYSTSAFSAGAFKQQLKCRLSSHPHSMSSPFICTGKQSSAKANLEEIS